MVLGVAPMSDCRSGVKSQYTFGGTGKWLVGRSFSFLRWNLKQKTSNIQTLPTNKIVLLIPKF